MITIIDGAKGTGKTKKMLDMINSTTEDAKGINVVLTTTDRYRVEIKPEVRFVDVTEEGVNNYDRLIGFIKGLICGNYDIEKIFIDGANRMLGVEIDSPAMADLMMTLDTIGGSSMVNFVLTISCDRANLPAFIQKYVK